MTEAIAEFFGRLFGDNVIIATILVAVIPMIELKGAIPFGMSKSFWGEKALGSWSAFGCGFFGSILVVPILALIFKPIYNWMKDKKFFRSIVNFFTGDIEKRKEKTDEKSKERSERAKLWLKILAVFLFVAFPVPLTGVWTGTCFAVLLGLNFWQVCATVIAGNAVCGLIVTTLCMVFPNATTIFLYVFLAIIVVAFAVKLILHFVNKSRDKKEKNIKGE